MPTPHENETEKEFMSRCMAYPDLQDKPNDQRAAICHSLFKQKKDIPNQFNLIGPKGTPEIDVKTMSARCIFATDDIDRMADIISIAGIQTKNHEKNPIVLYEHGEWFPDAIGKSIDPNGRYTVELLEHAAYATTYFFPTQLGEQYFNLIEMGGLNTNSIGYRPIQKRKNNKGGYFLDVVELVEISWVGVPANAECVRAFLSKDRICGKQIHPVLVKALKPIVSELQAKANNTVRSGWVALKGGFIVSELNKEVKQAPAPEPKPETATPAALPHGAEMLGNIHANLTAMVEYCEQELPRLENEKLAKGLLKFCNGLLTSMAGFEDSFKSEYPDQTPLPDTGTQAVEALKAAKAEAEAKPEEKPGEKQDEKPGEKQEEKPAEKKYNVGKVFVKQLTDGDDATDDDDDIVALTKEIEALPEAERKSIVSELEKFVQSENLELVHKGRLERAQRIRI